MADEAQADRRECGSERHRGDTDPNLSRDDDRK